MSAYIEFIVVIGLIIGLWVILKRSSVSYRALKAHPKPVPADQMEEHVIKMAGEHSVSDKKSIASWPMPRMDDNYHFILSVYTQLNDDIQQKHDVSPAAEWILDNFYLIEEQVKQLRCDLTKKSYLRLPVLKNGPFKGHARIFALVMELSVLSDGQIDETKLIRCLKAYQEHNRIFDREIWALPIVIKLALLENIRNICEKIKNTQIQWNKADDMIDKMLVNKDADEENTTRLLQNIMKQGRAGLPFIEHLSYRLRILGPRYAAVSKYVNEYLGEQKMEAANRQELRLQSSATVSAGNNIASLKYFAIFDWSDLFEAVSFVGQILSKDPDGTYPLMDIATRNTYRSKIEELSSACGIEEARIAAKAIELAATARKERNEGAARTEHVGYYLIGKGIEDLYKALKAKTVWVPAAVKLAREHPQILYIGSIILITLLLAGGAAQYAIHQTFSHQWVWALIAIIAVFIASSEVAVSIVNWVVAKTIKAAIFPALELKDGIPESMSTMIVIPTLLPDQTRVKEILGNLETHYLSNRDKNLYFALVGAFKDSDEEVAADLTVIHAAMSGVKALNEKYMNDGTEIFYYFHRTSQYSPENKKWIGWERKRGALMEFNDLLLGCEETSFSYRSTRVKDFSKIKYIITLDSDTILPIGMAKKMIATMAHPLNRPVIDPVRGVVVEGYGLMQPRVDFDSEHSGKSPFSKIYTGQVGIDPYSSAISDVYQDMFGEGIYTGKGIYDLKVFQKILKDAIPENKILSHDLYEGSYVRAALVTNLKLVEAYPTKYNSLSARLYRWIRGDWQLIPFLFHSIPSGVGMIKNPLSLLSKWKMFDNLRRSLVSPALMVLLALSLTILPGNLLLWLGYVLVALLFPLISSAMSYVLSGSIFTEKIKSYIPIIIGLKAMVYQAGLTFLFLPYQAYSMMKAVLLTLWRVYVSKKNMLEWVTSADSEASQKETLSSYYGKMHASIWQALVIVALVIGVHPQLTVLSVILFAAWSTAPCVAYRISRECKDDRERVSDEHAVELRRIARGTWRYFEEFANEENNYLAPDNFQQEPYRGVAERTSPTNIGLGLLSVLTARDMGYIGILEMTGQLAKTISSIEALQKWNGHLYNWYNTKTLEPLNPPYVSTVDSGNLVCYLITLAQGLQGYLERPLVDQKCVEGILDTLGCAEQDGFKAAEITGYLKEWSLRPFDLTAWSELMKVLSQEGCFGELSDCHWRNKIERMIANKRAEQLELMPWTDMLASIPQTLTGRLSVGQSAVLDETMAHMKANPNLCDLPSVCKRAFSFFDTLTANGDDETAVWLCKTMNAFVESSNAAEAFLCRYKDLMKRIKALADATRFLPLYDAKKQLFPIGYSIKENKLSSSYYDLLASEARQTSFIAIARGEVPATHWFKLGRTLTVMDGYKGLVSWTGTMFEYLMPLLIMKSYKNTLLDESYAFAVRNQKKYGVQRGMPWGASESGYYSMDNNLDYKYKAVGVPWLGLKRGLIGDAVVAPYATFLALMVDPVGALKNLTQLKAAGMEGGYGFFEAADYTKKRLTNRKMAIVKSYMAHHQGMSLLAINNYLNQNIMQKRFHADPEVRAARLLLQEKIPGNVVFTKEEKEKVVPAKGAKLKESNLILKYHKPDRLLPKTHILTNGDYSVVITDRGTGFSETKEVVVTRWREDSTLDPYGMFYFVRNVETGAVWSCAYAPLNILPEKYEVTFTSDKAQFKRVDGHVETTTEIVVASGDNVEIRRVSLKNLGEKMLMLELTGYFEVVLATQAQDAAHPAFSNLFIKTEYAAEKYCIFASRRPRSNEEKTWCAANRIVLQADSTAGVQFETDRMKFIGRGRSIASPLATEGEPLSGSDGPVLDPVMSLRARVSIEPGSTAVMSFVTAVGDTKESLLRILGKYSSPEAVEAAFYLAKVRSQLEAKHLHIPEESMALYEEMIPHILFISPLKRQHQDMVSKNTRGQAALWAYGISGDQPIVLAVIDHTEDKTLILDIMKAHEYWWMKGLKVDLVILANMDSGYGQPFRDFVSDVESGQLRGKEKAYVLNANEIPEAPIFYAAARIVLKDDGRTLREQMNAKTEQPQLKSRRFTGEAKEYSTASKAEKPGLLFFNRLGGFLQDGSEYVIRLKNGENTPAPWVNVVANPGFGFLVSESGSSYTWRDNSRENKLTPWSNDAVCDSPGEVLYIVDNDTGETWTVTALPLREPGTYDIRHGFGYSVFAHDSHGIRQSLTQFVPLQDPVKISLLNLVNDSAQKRSLCLTYYVRPVLGVGDQITAMHIGTRLSKSGTLLFDNPYNEEFAGYTGFLDASVKERQVTGDRKEFLGAGGIASPDALKHEKLSGIVGTGLDPCAVVQVNIKLMPNESMDAVFLLGMSKQASQVELITKKYTVVSEAKNALDKVKRFWREKLCVIQADTPSASFDLMVNGWLQYQVISCRLWARTSVYQVGGAFGFRDQLQDCLSILTMWPELARSQILLHARHQFKEGDVQHWWHEPWGRGTRTRCSDDLLWLPYVTAEYVKVTGDEAILKTQLPFLEDEVLEDGESERYARPRVSTQTATLFEHCSLAIDKAAKFGVHGLPFIGSGDWNDGMNKVGEKGKGESVWLGWFMISVLKSFAPVCSMVGEASRANEYIKMSQTIAQSMEENTWDGEWYRRAYFDDGKILGSREGSECSIDSIAQSWAVLSGAADAERASAAMDSLKRHLVDRESGIIKLLTPPFDLGELEPGYIKGYLPGIRENGGQYTHAAAWAIMAWAKLGAGGEAWEHFDLVNPINHAQNPVGYSTYKLEPYVMAADVYSLHPNAGRGGWSWYTGSAGWMYKTALGDMLGFQKIGSTIAIDPCIPPQWREYAIEYRYFGTLYKIRVYNPEGVSKGIAEVLINGTAIEGNVLCLVDDGAIHYVKVIMGKRNTAGD
ncbi:MAG TPA: glucoamylase family protein [Syntrophomonas sp.]|nr:glucoamylase family protein [Syntrophomonas sp.]